MKYNRCYNFSAGPAMLPLEVMEEAQAEFLNWHDSGMSVMEISHRSDEFKALAQSSENDLRDLLNIPEDYSVLFLHGGARSQFAMVPMNLSQHFPSAAYLVSGIWSNMAAEEARLYTKVNLIAPSDEPAMTHIPSPDTWSNFEEAAYLYYVDNETINGLEFNYVPNSGQVPLICDMASNLLTRPVDINRYGVIFACAQKNLGPAGVTVVIIKNELLERTPWPFTPSMFNYKLHANAHSMQNTSPTYPWYILSLVLKWAKKQGGIKVLNERSLAKSSQLYRFIDEHELYINTIHPEQRSRINVVFQLARPELEDLFLQEADKAGLKNLKGHRYIGGLRASLYNAMPMEGVHKLIGFMDEFAKRNH